ncbi:hypothetical protein JHFBIEKO_3095 [Methylobacterium mesophilicum]|uniref:glycosyltransferase family 2 protein n=1 Tax=Methylobacterium mesophilicum TaxID=39956 RepID=UPI001EE2BD01|nr:glycosyltransferase family 2 protein [Methylobacterium mesophilicum]GJE22639.1 hypothetical protein JHFBIEKO_3095 [Methylobacterium mesophilicum]
MGCTLVAIARNESDYLAEWLAFHITVGFDSIIVFDHDSSDETAAVVSRSAACTPNISLRSFIARPGESPQLAAYRTALSLVRTPWVAFFDVDEFLVPWQDGSVDAYLNRVPADVSAVHVNWRSFGSSGLIEPSEGLVTETFLRCAEPDWAYQGHYKTFARTERVRNVQVHEVVLSGGRRTLSDFSDIPFDTTGMTNRVVYAGIQLNHYQTKSRAEFERRMQLPRAGVAQGESVNRLADREWRFALLDRNETEDRHALMFQAAVRRQLALIS